MGTRIIGIDFESTFSSEHTLTKMSIEEYVRHPKFEIIGCGIRDFQTGESRFVRGNEVEAALAEIKGNAWVAHHSQFDGFIAHTMYGLHPSFWFDTLSMSRALYQHLPSHSLDKLVAHFNLGTPKTVPYNQFRGKALAEIDGSLFREIGSGCEHDLFLTHQLYELLVPQMPADELELIDETIRLYTEPVLVGDVPLLTDALTEAIIAREHKMHEMGLTDKVLKSDAKFATLLRGCGIEPPTKISATTGREAFAFAKSDLEFQALLDHEDGHVRDLVEARFAAKTSIHETRAGRLLGMAERGTIPVYLKWYGAHTGRPSGGDKCLTADTQILVLDCHDRLAYKCIIDVLLTDLVWDGEEFVAHEGVKFQGYHETITHDGITGTPEHQVYIGPDTTCTLAEASERGARIMDCPEPTAWALDAANRSRR